VRGCRPVRRRGHWSGGAAGTRGERGQGEQGGVAQVGGSTARRPADRGRSRRAVQRRTGGLRGARVATTRALAPGAPAQFPLGPFNCAYLQFFEQKWSKR
jgi:hypothetical protein